MCDGSIYLSLTFSVFWFMIASSGIPFTLGLKHIQLGGTHRHNKRDTARTADLITPLGSAGQPPIHSWAEMPGNEEPITEYATHSLAVAYYHINGWDLDVYCNALLLVDRFGMIYDNVCLDWRVVRVEKLKTIEKCVNIIPFCNINLTVEWHINLFSYYFIFISMSYTQFIQFNSIHFIPVRLHPYTYTNWIKTKNI